MRTIFSLPGSSTPRIKPKNCRLQIQSILDCATTFLPLTVIDIDELKMIRFSISFLLVLGFQEFVLNLNHRFRLPRKFRRDKANDMGGETAKMRFCLLRSLFYLACSDQVTKDNSMRGCSSSLEPNIRVSKPRNRNKCYES